MSYTDAISRVGAIQDQIASMRTAFIPPAQTSSTASTASTPAAVGAPASASASASASLAPASATTSETAPTSFSSALSSALSTSSPTALPTATTLPTTAGVTGGAALPSRATTLLTSDQQRFASRLAADTGLDPGVVSAWLLSEESGGAATSRQSQHNNDWLNIGYTDSATYGSGDSIWSDPDTAADATAGWLKGQNTIPGYGTASSGVQGILATAGQAPSAQISALQGSGWASSGYPQLASLYSQVAG